MPLTTAMTSSTQLSRSRPAGSGRLSRRLANASRQPSSLRTTIARTAASRVARRSSSRMTTNRRGRSLHHSQKALEVKAQLLLRRSGRIACRAELLHGISNDGVDQILLGREMMMERRMVDAGRRRDIAQAQALEATIGNDFERSFDQHLPAAWYIFRNGIKHASAPVKPTNQLVGV